MTELVFGVETAARYCGIAKSTLYNYRSKGKFPKGLKTAGVISYTAGDLDAWKLERANAPKPKRGRKAAPAEQPAVSV